MKVVNLCWGEAEQLVRATPTSRSTSTDRWKWLFEELETWYQYRPQELLPAVELDFGRSRLESDQAVFPAILCTNGAAIFGNQLYHTAMLILLLHKPRTARLKGGPHSSILWHAERICGIGLNNDRRECWDPCLLASLLVASRRMTHLSQRTALLKGFERIQALTGFNVTEYLNALCESWHPIDDF